MPLYSPGRRRAIVLLLLSSMLLITLDLRGNALLDSARSAWHQVLRPFESAAEVVARPIRNAWRGITDYDDLEAENRRLQDEVDAARSNDIAARALLSKLNALLDAQDLDSLSRYDRVTAGVIGPSPSNLDQIVEIDKGRNHGVREGMLVVTSAGFVVGKITRAFLDTSYVMLLTDTDYFLGVRIVRPADELPEPQFVVTTTTTTTTTTTVPPADSLAPGETPAPTAAATTTTRPTTTTTTTPSESGGPGGPGGPVDSVDGSLPPPTTTAVPVDPLRETGLLNGRGAGVLPEVELVADTPGFGTPEVGDAVLTAGGSTGLAPPDALVGRVSEVIQGSPSQGLILRVTPFANVDSLDFVEVIMYQPASEASTGGGGD